MGAETRFAAVVFGSLVLWLPALNAVLRGELDAGVGGLRYAMGALLAWVGVNGLDQVIKRYAAVQRGQEACGMTGGEADDAGDAGHETAASSPRRRADDHTGTGSDDPAPG